MFYINMCKYIILIERDLLQTQLMTAKNVFNVQDNVQDNVI
jgi:hypothetical protein